MQTVATENLKSFEPTPAALFHESGEMLFQPGEVLIPSALEALRNAGIDTLLRAEKGESLGRFLFEARNRSLPADGLAVGQTLSAPIYDGDGSLLIRENTPISPAFMTQLANRETTRIFIRRGATEMKLPQVERFRSLLGERNPDRERLRANDYEGVRRTFLDDASGLSADALDLQIGSSSAVVTPTGTGLRTLVRQNSAARISEETRRGYLEVWKETLVFAKSLFPDQKAPREIRTEGIGEATRKVINALIDHKDLLFSLVLLPDPDAYLSRHLLNVTVLSIHLGTALGFNADQIYELAHGAFLHDIGMFALPPALYMNPARLSEAERTQVQRHTIYGIDLLQHARGVPWSSAYIAYQHHERIDGSGYPKSRQGITVHTFSRIVMIADIFDAMISERPYRTPMLPYTAMKTLLQMGVGAKLDRDMVNQFLDWVSLYPIGSWVMLEDGRVGRVVSAREGDPKRPVVTVLLDREFRLLADRPLIDTSAEGAPAILSAVDGAAFDLPPTEGF